jgi:2'-5' RNA ligase
MTDKRTFIAIPLPDEIKTYLARVKDLLEPVSDGVKWVDPVNMHITLKFLGDTPEWLLDDVKNEFFRIASDVRPFHMQLKHLGQFPREGDPRILWAGLQKVPPVVYRLSDEFNTGFLALGFDDTGKRFKPHITLGRVKQKLHEDLVPSFYDIEMEPIVFDVKKLVWFESTHRHGHLKYVPLEEYSLK